jgi:hypothetical protein
MGSVVEMFLNDFEEAFCIRFNGECFYSVAAGRRHCVSQRRIMHEMENGIRQSL